MSDGKFFEKRAQPKGGRFFGELGGRDTGNFHKEANSAYGPGVGAAMSGQMGGSFGVGQSATGGGMYGTGDGDKKKKLPYKKPPADDDAQVAENSVNMEDGEKKAEVNEESHTPGQHRAAEDQPSSLESGGARFLQESHGAKPVDDPLTSGLGKQRMKKSAQDLRFLGTGFAKKAGPDLPGTVASDVRSTPGAAKDWGGRVGRSAHQGAESVWRGAKDVVSKGADTVADSKALSLTALLAGGLLAARGGGRAAKAVMKMGRRKKSVPQGLLAKVRKKIKG
jgi:hypothetical protein